MSIDNKSLREPVLPKYDIQRYIESLGDNKLLVILWIEWWMSAPFVNCMDCSHRAALYLSFRLMNSGYGRVFVPPQPQDAVTDTLYLHLTLQQAGVMAVLCVIIRYAIIFSGQCARFLLSVFILLDYVHVNTATDVLNLDSQGLTSIPLNLPCTLNYIFFRKNQITRVEDLSFKCLGYLVALSLDNNKLNFISPAAFDPHNSFIHLELRHNPDLIQLPPSFGPNTANIPEVHINGIGLPDAPSGFMQNMTSLTVVGYSLNISNEFFDDCNNPNLVWHSGPSAPNLTYRTPALGWLNVYGVTDGYLPDENVRGWSRLGRVNIGPPGRNIPVFEGAILLNSIHASSCKVKSIPNLTHLPSLQVLQFSTEAFECDIHCCWMLFENLWSPIALSWLHTIICQGPEMVRGQNISQLSPVQARCFQSKFHSINCIPMPWYLKTATRSQWSNDRLLI